MFGIDFIMDVRLLLFLLLLALETRRINVNETSSTASLARPPARVETRRQHAQGAVGRGRGRGAGGRPSRCHRERVLLVDLVHHAANRAQLAVPARQRDLQQRTNAWEGGGRRERGCLAAH